MCSERLQECDGAHHPLWDVDYMVKKVVGGFGLGDSHVVWFTAINLRNKDAAGVNDVFIFVVRVERVPMSFTGVGIGP